jgi:hypothetical protein
MWLIWLIEGSAVVAGIVALIAGQYFAHPMGVPLGIFLIGAGIALRGLETVVTGRGSFRRSREVYSPTAGIIGLMALALGAILIGSAYLGGGVFHSTVSDLARRPGAALIGGGLLAVGAGVLMMINLVGHRSPAWTLLLRVPWFLFGFILVVVGLQVIGLGIWELLAPRAFDSFVGDMQKRFDWRVFERWWKRLSGYF